MDAEPAGLDHKTGRKTGGGSASDATTALREAEHLVRADNFAAAVALLEGVVDRDPILAVLYLLASTNLELGDHDKAFYYATRAVETEPASAPAHDVLAKVLVAQQDFVSALAEFEPVATLARDERLAAGLTPYSAPAHFALHNVEQLEHILGRNGEGQGAAGGLAGDLHRLRQGLTDAINAAAPNGEVPSISLNPVIGRMVADPPYVRVSEERLSAYLNPEIDYGSLQQALVAGKEFQVIDDFLTPEALEQLRTFCLESTVWRHPYQFGYVGAFPEHGFASVSLFAIAEEFASAMGEPFVDFQLAAWWAFAYDTKLPGTDIHGDDADYSLNLWITPDSANLDPDSGGLVMWDKKGAQRLEL